MDTTREKVAAKFVERLDELREKERAAVDLGVTKTRSFERPETIRGTSFSPANKDSSGPGPDHRARGSASL